MKRIVQSVLSACLLAVAAMAYGNAWNLVPKLAANDVDSAKSAYSQLHGMGAGAVDALISGLGSDDELIRYQCARLLANVGSPAVDDLELALHHPDWRVRAWSALALGEMHTSRAVSPLIDALEDSHWWVRAQSAVSLGQTGDSRAISALNALANDEDERVRQRALFAVNMLRNTIVTEPPR